MKDFEESEPKETNDWSNYHQKTISALLLIFVTSTVYTILRSIFFTTSDFAIAQAPVVFYFTIQANILICIWLSCIIINIISGGKKFKFVMSINLAAALTSYSAVNALIFWFVMVPLYALSADMPIFSPQNIWMHTTTPFIAAVVLNYVFNENEKPLFKTKLILSMIYPFLYVIFAGILALNGIYLYPMFDPSLVGGWIGVAACMAGTVVFVAIIYTAITQLLKNKFE